MFGFSVSIIIVLVIAVLALLAIMDRDHSGRFFAEMQA